MLKLIRTAAVLALALGLVAFAAPAGAAPEAAGPTTWTVLAGSQAIMGQTEHGLMGAWQVMQFYPDKMTINAGDTIVWKLNSVEPHTVTFPKPGEQMVQLVVPEGGSSQRMLMNGLAALPQGGSTYDGSAFTGSGQLGGEPQNPTEYRLTFTKPGTYQYYCAFHDMMKGTVVVQAAGTAYPQAQAEIDRNAKTKIEADQQTAQQLNRQIPQPGTRGGPNGSTTHQITMGYGDGKSMDWMRFGPANLTIHVGDTVEWVQGDPMAPHTVTITSGGAEPALVLPEAQQSGPPKLVINPQVLMPVGGNTYNGEGYFNSGFIWGSQMPQPGPRTYSLTFTKAGTYEYICVLHDAMGMNGKITVVPAGQALGQQGGQNSSQGSAPVTLPVTGGATVPAAPFVLGLALIAVGSAIGARRQPRNL